MTLLPLVFALFTEPPHPTSEVFLAQEQAIEEMHRLFPDVEIDVRWLPCEQENSAYDPESQTIYLCTEMADEGKDVAIGVAAHEFAHAVLDQRTGTSTELDADELSALMLIRFGHHDPITAVARWFTALDEPQYPGDPHPSTAFRAWELACINSGSLGEGPAQCRDLYNGLRVRYNARLGLSTP